MDALEVINRLKENQHDKDVPPHLSANSLSKHMRCPRQWQESYMFGKRDAPSSSIVIGSAVHTGLSRLFKQEALGDPWKDTLDEQEHGVEWGKDTPEKAQGHYEAMLYHYWETIGKYLNVVASEKEVWIEVSGVGIPIMGYVDAETPERLIDFKSTAYYNRKQVRPNKEWKFQQGIYQLEIPKPSEVHVLTRSKTDPVVVPDSPSHPLYLGLVDSDKIARMVQDEWWRILYHAETYGDNPWPGNSMHEWAAKYCGVEECCAL